jgi:HdeA/HdeB family
VPPSDGFAGRRAGTLTMSNPTKWFDFIAVAACIVMVATATAASAQPQNPPQRSGPVTALVIMTPNGPATCATWVQWRLPTAHPSDKAAVEYWVEGYLSGLAAGSHHDVIGQFRRDALAAWLDQYCTANPQTPLPAAVNALGLQMLAHPGGPL